MGNIGLILHGQSEVLWSKRSKRDLDTWSEKMNGKMVGIWSEMDSGK